MNNWTFKPVDIIPQKADMINNRVSFIVEVEIEEFLANPELNLRQPTTRNGLMPMRSLWLLPHQRIMTLKTTPLIPLPLKR
ncbi:hypothetical protein [Candidatus Sororendozoicomonas aggregata]|uniref:hypothetical protein n=1 Tax=Candidatus Sororendozoicomonas aggregata TaxID=3073239 RepID=UPI002ED207FD